MRWTITAKLGAISALGICVTVGVSVFQIYKEREATEAALATRTQSSIQKLANQAYGRLRFAQTGLRDILMANDPATADKGLSAVLQATNDAEQAAREASQLAIAPENRTRLEKIAGQAKTYGNSAKDIHAASHKYFAAIGQRNEALKSATDELAAVRDGLGSNSEHTYRLSSG